MGNWWLANNVYTPSKDEVLSEWINFWCVEVNGRKWPTISRGADSAAAAKRQLDNPYELVLDESSVTIINDREFMMVDHGTGDVYRFKWYPQDRWYEGVL